MKVIVFILSFIILGLGSLPCTDTKDVALKGTSSVQTATQPDLDHGPNKFDLCNPFCSCACCGTTVASVKLPSLTAALPQYFLAHEEAFVSASVQSIAKPIWQPPQLVA